MSASRSTNRCYTPRVDEGFAPPYHDEGRGYARISNRSRSGGDAVRYTSMGRTSQLRVGSPMPTSAAGLARTPTPSGGPKRISVQVESQGGGRPSSIKVETPDGVRYYDGEGASVERSPGERDGAAVRYPSRGPRVQISKPEGTSVMGGFSPSDAAKEEYQQRNQSSYRRSASPREDASPSTPDDLLRRIEAVEHVVQNRQNEVSALEVRIEEIQRRIDGFQGSKRSRSESPQHREIDAAFAAEEERRDQLQAMERQQLSSKQHRAQKRQWCHELDVDLFNKLAHAIGKMEHKVADYVGKREQAEATAQKAMGFLKKEENSLVERFEEAADSMMKESEAMVGEAERLRELHARCVEAMQKVSNVGAVKNAGAGEAAALGDGRRSSVPVRHPGAADEPITGRPVDTEYLREIREHSRGRQRPSFGSPSSLRDPRECGENAYHRISSGSQVSVSVSLTHSRGNADSNTALDRTGTESQVIASYPGSTTVHVTTYDDDVDDIEAEHIDHVSVESNDGSHRVSVTHEDVQY